MPVPTLLLTLLLAYADTTSMGTAADRSMIVKGFDEVTFKPIIPTRPDGPQIGILRGNPDEGPSDMILKLPKGPGTLHTHSADYHLTIISGEMKHWDESGEEAKVRALGPGSYWFQPGGEPHADSCLSEECVMFIHWSGKRDGQLYRPQSRIEVITNCMGTGCAAWPRSDFDQFRPQWTHRGAIPLSNAARRSAAKDREMKPALLFIPLAAVAGCSTGSGKAPGRITYACNYGPDLSIDYGPNVANIQSPDGIVTLRQRSSSTGFSYESATHSLRVNGDNITYKDRQMAPRQCHAI